MGAIEDELGRYFRGKKCMHPLASSGTCGRVIAAHTIQRAGALTRVLDQTGHSLSFYPPTKTRLREPQKVGVRSASTFGGFCDRHDGPTFAAVETVPFLGTPEQCFLLAYRAECHELYQKKASFASHSTLRQKIDRGRSPETQRLIHEYQREMQDNVGFGLSESQRHKELMDRELLSATFDAYKTVFVTFRGATCVVCSGASTPDRTLSGRSIAERSYSAHVPRLYVSTVPHVTGGCVTLTWRRDESEIGVFTDDLRSQRLGRLPGLIVQYIFAHIENVFFSEGWWYLLTEDERARVADLVRLVDPWQTPPSYGPLGVPWEITSVADKWPTD
jgi:hypothetical protein